MSAMQNFDVVEAPLTGVHLVEANAGTGKTWNIEALVIRLLIKNKLEPAQVLVVTFTDAAAQELRERILDRLNRVYEVLGDESYTGSDLFIGWCFGKYRGDTEVMEHLEKCKSRFDEASIYTIHSFCKQVLTDFRFEAGLETEMQILPDSRIIQQEVIKDEWRYLNHRFSRQPESVLSGLLTGKVSLDQLENSFRVYASVNSVHLDTDSTSLLRNASDKVRSRWGTLPVDQWSGDFISTLNKAIRIWDSEKEEVRSQWLNTEISRYDYAKDGLKWEEALEHFLDNPLSNKISTHVEKFTSSFIQDKPLKKSSTAPRPNHGFFELIDLLYYAKPVLENQILRDSCVRMRRSYLQKRQQQQVLIFDDLLAYTARALDPVIHGHRADDLVIKLREKYPVALIDEFQDTDQVQFSIFRRIYIDEKSDDRLLYMIGDPKQSIYLFRGADLKTYFKARSIGKSTFTLSKNFRSTEALISGVNKVFSGVGCFLDAELDYTPSTANKTEPGLRVGHESVAPVRFVEIPSNSDTKGVREASIMRWVVTSISNLLSGLGSETTVIDKVTGERRRVNPGDIAILVARHDQSKRFKKLFAEVDIPTVESGDASVFLSDEASYLNLLLEVIMDPKRSRKVRALLTTPLFGLTRDEVAEIEGDDSRWSEYIESFRIGEKIIIQNGILAGLRFIYDHLSIESTLVKSGNGERALTNLRHLSELLHSEEESQRRSLAGLASWLLAQRTDANTSSSDDRNMRLESDDERVRILTMHRSKGLQFPIVYAPFLWTKAWGKKSEIFYVNDVSNGDYIQTYDPDNLVHSSGEELSRLEALQDKIRLFYVSLTRAEERCYIPYSPGKEFQYSPIYAAIASKLVRDGVCMDEFGRSLIDGSTSLMDLPADWDQRNLVSNLLSELAKVSIDSLHFELMDSPGKPVKYTQKRIQIALEPRKFSDNHKKRLYPGRLMTSYSSIQRKYGHDSPIDSTRRDEHIESDTSLMDESIITPSSSSHFMDSTAIFNFPKGATTGNYWHEVLETIDFSDSADWEQTIDQISAKYGFNDDSDKKTTLLLVLNTVESPIGKLDRFASQNPEYQSLKLSQLGRGQTLREMEFLYPYSQSILQLLLETLKDSQQSDTDVSVLANIENLDTTSLLTGLIDLVFEYKGRFFILDYKSNHLGDSMHAYQSEALKKDIWINGYNLQYHLYIAALVKYLYKQIQGFDYDRHFGGVFYLYWRGLNSSDTSGVYYDKPDWKRIEPLMESIANSSYTSAKTNIANVVSDSSKGGES